MKLKYVIAILPLLLPSGVTASADWTSEIDDAFGAEAIVESNGYTLVIGCNPWVDGSIIYIPAQPSEFDVEQLKTRDPRLFFNIDGEELVVDVEPRGGGGILEFVNFGNIDEYTPELVESLIAAARTLEVTILLSNPTENAWRQELSVRGSTQALTDVSSWCEW